MANNVSIDVTGDPVAVNLARAVLIGEIVSSLCLVLVLAAELPQGRKLTYRINWELDKLKKRYRDRNADHRRFRVQLGELLMEAQSFLEKNWESKSG
jgi:hypothetical protein